MRCFVCFFLIIEAMKKNASPDFRLIFIFLFLKSLRNMSKWLQVGDYAETFKRFLALLLEEFLKATSIKNETTNLLSKEAKEFILEAEKHTVLSGKACLPGCV